MSTEIVEAIFLSVLCCMMAGIIALVAINVFLLYKIVEKLKEVYEVSPLFTVSGIVGLFLVGLLSLSSYLDLTFPSPKNLARKILLSTQGEVARP